MTRTTWIDDHLPLPRPEYAKQPEALLTDLLWRSEGSSLGKQRVIEQLPGLRGPTDDKALPDPERLVPLRLGSGGKTLETFPLAVRFSMSRFATSSPSTPSPVPYLLSSLFAPKARGDKSTACVPLHPSTVALQTLHGLVNKSSPANLAKAIESMGWLGGALEDGAVASSYLKLFQAPPNPRQGATGAIESLLPQLASHVWAELPVAYAQPQGTWTAWPEVTASTTSPKNQSLLAAYKRTPFSWFWAKWRTLCDAATEWHDRLPARRLVDWALCLLRTGLAFSYIWEAEFFSRVHTMVASRRSGTSLSHNPIRVLLEESAALATIERPNVPISQKSIWPSLADLIARGWRVRSHVIDIGGDLPNASSFPDAVEQWVASLTADQVELVGAPIRTTAAMASNQKEFVRYLLQPRSSDNDSMDQADFYSLARTNGKHFWFRPGPEWLVVVTSLLCGKPGGLCTLGDLTADLVALGMHVERAVLVGLLEDAGLCRDSPDADDALVIHSGF